MKIETWGILGVCNEEGGLLWKGFLSAGYDGGSLQWIGSSRRLTKYALFYWIRGGDRSSQVKRVTTIFSHMNQYEIFNFLFLFPIWKTPMDLLSISIGNLPPHEYSLKFISSKFPYGSNFTRPNFYLSGLRDVEFFIESNFLIVEFSKVKKKKILS